MVMFILQRCDGSIGKTFLEHGTAWTEAPSRNGRVGSEKITIPMWLTSKTQMGSQERKGWEKWVGARQPRAIGAHAEGMENIEGF